MCSGDSANAVPPTKKLRTRVTNICGDRRGQPNRSAMERPHSGPTAVVIAVQPVPGKYDWYRLCLAQSRGSSKNKSASNMYVPIKSVQERKFTMTEAVCIHVTIAIPSAKSPRCSNGHAVAACPHTTRGHCEPESLLRSGDKTRVFPPIL